MKIKNNGTIFRSYAKMVLQLGPVSGAPKELLINLRVFALDALNYACSITSTNVFIYQTNTILVI